MPPNQLGCVRPLDGSQGRIGQMPSTDFAIEK